MNTDLIIYLVGIIPAWFCLKLSDTPVGYRISAIIGRLFLALFSWCTVIFFIVLVILGLFIRFFIDQPFWNKNGPKWL